MNKIYFNSLGFIVTKKCNMACPHCLRGEPVNENIDIKYIKKILEHTAFIGSLVFSGGEPSLNTLAMQETLNLCKKFHIPVLRTDISTNGKYVSDDFIKIIKDWHDYCKICYPTAQLTNDIYHESIPEENKNKLLKTGYVIIRTNIFDDDNHVINMGRAKNLKNVAKDYEFYVPTIKSLDSYKFNNDYYINNFEFMVTCNGGIVLTCDYDFSTEKNITYFNVDNLLKILEEYSFETKDCHIFIEEIDKQYLKGKKYAKRNCFISNKLLGK